MKINNNTDENQFLIIPVRDLAEIKEKLSLILKNMSLEPNVKNKHDSEYMDQTGAEKYLNKKTTWFWQQRKAGKLSFKKLGNKNFYKKSELDRLFED